MDAYEPQSGEFPPPDQDPMFRSVPPRHEVGQAVPIVAILGRSSEAVVALRGITAYSTGFLIEIAARLRTPDLTLDNPRLSSFTFSGHSVTESTFLIGFEFPDGTKSTNLDFPNTSRAAPTKLHVDLYRGNGNPSGRDVSWWVWPLPPPTQIVLVCRWTAYGIGLARHTLDGDAICRAASRSEDLFA